ncbi:MAG: sugar phosphate isomerase/epimerase family protein [Betaproteobacteria bacterium]
MDRKDSPFAINTYSYTLSHTARATLESLASRGYSEFELMMYPGHLWPADFGQSSRAELRQFIDANGLKVKTLNMPNIDLNVAGAAAEMRAYTLANLRSVVELAGDLDVPGVVIGPGKANPLFPAPTDRLMGYFYAALDELEPLARRVGTSLYVENMPFAFLPGIDELMKALDRYGNDRIGIVYDVANGHFINEDIGAALRKCRGRVKVVHLSDTNQKVYRHDTIGLGTVDFAPIPAVLEEIGFKEKPIFEIISPNADRDIEDSAAKLLAMGWGRTAR